MKTISKKAIRFVVASLALLPVFTLAGPANGQICTQPPAGLVSWWPLDEMTGTTVDDIVGANHGLLSGTTSVPGMVSTARRFVPTDRMDASGSGSLDISGNQVTIDAWIRLENNPTSAQTFTATVGKTGFPSDQPYLITFESGPISGGFFGTLPQNQWRFEYVLTNSVGLRVHDQNTGIDVTVDGQYHHFAMTYDGTNVSMYVDGVLRGSFLFSGTLKSVPAEPFRVFGSAPFSIDEVEIADRALTAAEIEAIFNAGSAGKCKVLTSFSPATLWVGLKNSDDQGTQFDVRTEVYINDTLVAEGENRCITGVTRNPTRAKEVSIEFGPVSDGAFGSGDELSLRLLTRIGTNPDDTKCSGPGGSHNNAVGLRLYYDAVSRPSRFGAEFPPDPFMDLFLHSNGTDFFLDAMPPTATAAKFKDSSAVNFAGGNSWKEIGTWSMTLP